MSADRLIRPYDIDCVVLSSSDQGDSWAWHEMEFAVCGNPWSAMLTDGSAMFVALTEHEDVRNYRANLRAYRSADGRPSSTRPLVSFGSGFDYPKIIYDPRDHAVYVIGSRAIRSDGQLRAEILVARSTDEGRSFPEPVVIAPSGLNMEAQTPAILTDGTLLVPYTEHSDPSGSKLPTARSWLLVSHDRGRTFSEQRSSLKTAISAWAGRTSPQT